MRWKFNLFNILICLFIYDSYTLVLAEENVDGIEENIDASSLEDGGIKILNETLKVVSREPGSEEDAKILNETNQATSPKKQLPINSVPPTVILPQVIPLPPISEIGEILLENEKSQENKTQIKDITMPIVMIESIVQNISEQSPSSSVPTLEVAEPVLTVSNSTVSESVPENSSISTIFSEKTAADLNIGQGVPEPVLAKTISDAGLAEADPGTTKTTSDPGLSEADPGSTKTSASVLVTGVPESVSAIPDIGVSQVPSIDDSGASPASTEVKDILEGENNEDSDNSLDSDNESKESTHNAQENEIPNLEAPKISPIAEAPGTQQPAENSTQTAQQPAQIDQKPATIDQKPAELAAIDQKSTIQDIKQVNAELLNIPDDLIALLRDEDRNEILKLAGLNVTEVPKLAKEELENRRQSIETPLPEGQKRRLRLEDECRPKLDLVFLLDTSGSIEQIYKEHVKWAVALVDSLPLEPDAVRVAAVQYAGFPLTEFALGTYPSAEDIRAHLEQIKFQSGVTRTGYALRKAELELFREDRGARRDSVKAIILFTDGLSVDDPAKPAQQLRDIKGVKIYVVNIGTDSFESEMMKIAGKQENIFGANDLQRLREAVLNDAERARGCSRVGPKIYERRPLKKFVTEGTPAPVLHPLSAFEIQEKLSEVTQSITSSGPRIEATTQNSTSVIQEIHGEQAAQEIQTMQEAQAMLEAVRKAQKTKIVTNEEGAQRKSKIGVQETPQERPQKVERVQVAPKKVDVRPKNVDAKQNAQEQSHLLVKIPTPQENFSNDEKPNKLPKEEPIKLKKKTRAPRPSTTPTPTTTTQEATSRTTRRRRIRTTTSSSTTTQPSTTTTARRLRLLRQRTSPRQEASKILDSNSRPLILESHSMIPRPNEVKVKSNNLTIHDEKIRKTTKVTNKQTTTTHAPTPTTTAKLRFRPQKPRSSKLVAIETSARDAFEMSAADRAKFEATSVSTTEKMLTTSKFLRKRIRTTTVSDILLQKVEEVSTTRKPFFRKSSTANSHTTTSTPLTTTTPKRRSTSTTKPIRRKLFGANIQNGDDKAICPMDLLFILDSSGSVQTFYEDQKKFLNEFLSVIELGENAHRVAMLQFAGNKMHKTEWPYDAYNNTMELLRAFNQMRHITGTTYIGSALNSAIRVLEGRRRDVPNIVLLLSDGFSQDDASFPASEIRRLANNQFYAVSITELSNRDYLTNIVGDANRVYVGPESEDLKNTIIDKLRCRA